MFKIGDKARVFCEGHSFHLKECEVYNIIGTTQCRVIVDGTYWYVWKNNLVPVVCIYANDRG